MGNALYGKPLQTDKIAGCLLSDVLVVYDICHCRCMTYPCSRGLRIELFASMVSLRSNCVSPLACATSMASTSAVRSASNTVCYVWGSPPSRSVSQVGNLQISEVWESTSFEGLQGLSCLSCQGLKLKLPKCQASQRLHMHYKNRSQNIEGVIKSQLPRELPATSTQIHPTAMEVFPSESPTWSS